MTTQLERYITHCRAGLAATPPVLIDQYLSRATEVDVDALCADTGKRCVRGQG